MARVTNRMFPIPPTPCCFCDATIEAGDDAHFVCGPTTGWELRAWHADREGCVEAHRDWLRMRDELSRGPV